MNPHWIQNIVSTVTAAARRCPHCHKTAAYPRKREGQFHTCQYCRHRFREKGSGRKLKEKK